MPYFVDLYAYELMSNNKNTTTKYDKYEDLFNDNYYVVPVAHKTIGTWAPDILKFMKDLASSVTWNYSNKRGI